MKFRIRICVAVALLVLAGCGGGGETPVPEPTPLRSGEVDSSYGTDGSAVFAASEGFSGMAVAPDGSVYVTGSNSILKLDPSGGEVASFGEAGRVRIPASSPVVDVAGNLYVISARFNSTTPSLSERFVAKLDPTGRLDPSFGIAGMTDPAIFASTRFFSVDRMVLDTEGSLYVAGTTTASSGGLVVTKLGRDGREVAQFGSAGLSTWPDLFISRVDALAVDGSGLVVAGPRFFTGVGSPARARIVKLDRASGMQAAGFGVGGIFDVSGSCSSFYVNALAPAPSEGLVYGGSCFFSGLYRATVQRLDRTGGRVTPFRDAGFDLFGPMLSNNYSVESMMVLALLPHADGHYAAGYRLGAHTCREGGVAKLDLAGEPVTAFGNNGAVSFDGLNHVNALGTDARGRLYLGGFRFTACTDAYGYAVYRLGG